MLLAWDLRTGSLFVTLWNLLELIDSDSDRRKDSCSWPPRMVGNFFADLRTTTRKELIVDVGQESSSSSLRTKSFTKVPWLFRCWFMGTGCSLDSSSLITINAIGFQVQWSVVYWIWFSLSSYPSMWAPLN
jgi:hypothetical protein